MALANGEDSNVNGECPGDAPRSGNGAGPGAKKECDEGHAKWTSLGDATEVPVNLTEAPSNSVAVMQLKVEFVIGSGESWREASSGEQVEQQDPNNLIETFKNVCAAA